MSRISDHDARHGRQGFTLVEIMVATSLLAIVLAGVLTAYIFMARNLTRLVNVQQQEVESRRTLRTFTEDLSAASQVTTATSTQLVLTKRTAASNVTVTYTYSATNGTLVRSAGAASKTLLTGLTSFTLLYYNEEGTAISSSLQSIKSAEMMFSSAAGTETSGTLARYTTVSPRIVLRNKSTLE
jgi:prepilin-type N-terminal cleavage/methylation domain-containing protein